MNVYTPGPWRVNGPQLSGTISVTSAHDGAVAVMIQHEVEGRAFPTEANARLIAAAPDLLAALESVLKHFDPWSMPGSDGERVVIEARAAIAKARGE